MSIVNLACSAMLAAAPQILRRSAPWLHSASVVEVAATGVSEPRLAGTRSGVMFKKRCCGLLSRRYPARMLAVSCANVQFGVLLPFGYELGAIILREEAVATQQFRKATGFDDSSPIENDDPIAVLHGR